MSDDFGTPIEEENRGLRYVDRLQEIRRAICTLDVSLTPSQMVGNKSVALSPMFGSLYQGNSNSSINLLDHKSILTPSKTPSILDNKENVTYFYDSFLENTEISDKTNKIKTNEALIKSYHNAYKENSIDDVMGVMNQFADFCVELHSSSRSMVSSVKHSKKLLHQINLTSKDLLDERYTWKLLWAIYSNKLAERSLLDEDMSCDSHMKIIDKLYSSNEDVLHLHTVLDWLQSNSAEQVQELPNKVGYFSGKVSWENTFHCLTNKQSKKLISSMDPDAVSREGLPLHEVDLEDQSRLVNHVFQLIRSGRIDEAQKLCITAGQFWRAAALDGWRLYNDPNYYQSQRESVEGNSSRGLWKMCCWQYCNSLTITNEEKAVYGALCGNLNAILPQCKTFHDKLWAHLKVLLDQKVEEELSDKSLPQSYWKQTLSLESIVNLMGKTKGSDELFNRIQLQLISHDIPGVIQTVADNIDDATISKSRFLCHLMLVLEVVHPGCANDTLYDAIIKYIKLLKEHGFMDEVIYYSTQLPTAKQVNTLTEVLCDVDDECRRACIDLATQYSIPIEEVAKNIYDKILSTYSNFVPDKASVSNVSEEDKAIISGLSWLLLLPTQRSTALIEGNMLMRRFITTRKHPSAVAVFSELPGDSIDIINKEWCKVHDVPLGNDDANAIREYLCLQAYLDSHQAYNDWCSHSAKRPPQPHSDTEGLGFSERVAADEKQKAYEQSLHRWEQNLITLTQLTRDKMLNVLLFIDGGWLVDEAECLDPLRIDQLKALRSQCIPATTFLLVNVLMESGQYKSVIELSEYIASEQYQLYLQFNKQELRVFLDKVYECSILMECDPLNYKELTEVV